MLNNKNKFLALSIFLSFLLFISIPIKIAFANLEVTEIMYSFTGSDTLNSKSREWIEIYNPTPNSIGVSAWSVCDNTSCETLPNVSISPNSFLILSGAEESELRSVWSIPPEIIFVSASGGTIGNGLNNGGDALSLHNLSLIVDQMSYGTNTSGLNPSIPTISTGHSYERDPKGKDTDTASDFVDRNPPTPGS